MRSPRRRAVIMAAGAAATTTVAGCSGAAVAPFNSLAQARTAVQGLATRAARTSAGWPLPQVLAHLAQSIEFSITGFPELKSGLFRATVGRAAFAVFDARGAMTHPLDQPIPGAPDLAGQTDLAAAAQRLVAAIDAFEAHTGALQPHFAYGALDRVAYARAHLMHIADHWRELAA